MWSNRTLIGLIGLIFADFKGFKGQKRSVKISIISVISVLFLPQFLAIRHFLLDTPNCFMYIQAQFI